MSPSTRIGVVSCSGESCAEGTVSRIATRLVLERLRPGVTVTICLPLFLSGKGGERMFARSFPTIAVDGCEKRCAKKAIEKYSGKTARCLVVTDLLRKWDMPRPGSRRVLDEKGLKAASKVADEIVSTIDDISRGERSRGHADV
jgi:uncharacterized metal-binding protein